MSFWWERMRGAAQCFCGRLERGVLKGRGGDMFGTCLPVAKLSGLCAKQRPMSVVCCLQAGAEAVRVDAYETGVGCTPASCAAEWELLMVGEIPHPFHTCSNTACPA